MRAVRIGRRVARRVVGRVCNVPGQVPNLSYVPIDPDKRLVRAAVAHGPEEIERHEDRDRGPQEHQSGGGKHGLGLLANQLPLGSRRFVAECKCRANSCFSCGSFDATPFK